MARTDYSTRRLFRAFDRCLEQHGYSTYGVCRLLAHRWDRKPQTVYAYRDDQKRLPLPFCRDLCRLMAALGTEVNVFDHIEVSTDISQRVVDFVKKLRRRDARPETSREA